MAIVQNLYQIFKLPASFLVENACNINFYTISRGKKDGNVVPIGDNIIFQQIRYLHNDHRDHHELFNYVTKLRESMHLYKKNGQYKEAHLLEQRISEILFVPDIVNVIVDKKKSDFNRFRTLGFSLNGVHYVYLCSGSGQIRRNTATFVNEKYHDILVKTINCGLDEKTSTFVLAKYTAYFALAFSSVLWVRTPRVCVASDFTNTLKQEHVDFIVHDDDGKAVIEERKMDIELNCFDGQGLIDPSFAIEWSKDMDLSYVPCSFVARSCFIKGNLATFDFKEFAHSHGISKIRDRWGVEYDIDNIDVILSESQFKTYKYYSSWQEYMKYASRGNIGWGVARYNKREDSEFSLANYQYIQSLSLSSDDVRSLISPTVNWIQKICSGNPAYSMLYSFGSKSEGVGYSNLYGSAQSVKMRAVVKNVEFLDDCYVQRGIYKNILETINQAKLGKIWVHGNYQFMVSDPVAQCEAVLGLPVVGVLGRDEIWSKFWVDRHAKTVDLCRSPMIDVHEHNPSHVHDSEKASHWFKYLGSGIIFSIRDTATLRAEDADFDGDIILSTDNEFFIKGSHKEHNTITYKKGLAVPDKMNPQNITKTVMKGFGSGVGGFSNTATILYAMAAMFDKPGHEDQHDEIMLRIKLLREIVGQEIDRIKGADKPRLPSEWRKFEQVSPDDSQEEVTAKMRRNAMVVSKKPYFFRYRYPDLNQRFKRFEASYNQVSRDNFGIKFKKLLKKSNKTREERDFVRRYQKYSPLITSPCTMNKLCREFENVDFDIKFMKDKFGNKKPSVSKLPSFEDKYSDSFDQKKFDFVMHLYKIYMKKSQRVIFQKIFRVNSPMEIPDLDYYEFLSGRIFDAIVSDLQESLSSNGMPGDEFLFYCWELSSSLPSFNWEFAWRVLGDQIISLIPRGRSFCPVRCSPALAASSNGAGDGDGDGKEGEGNFPAFSPDKPCEYLGNFYFLKDISSSDDDQLDEVSDIISGESVSSRSTSSGSEEIVRMTWPSSASSSSSLSSCNPSSPGRLPGEELPSSSAAEDDDGGSYIENGGDDDDDSGLES